MATGKEAFLKILSLIGIFSWIAFKIATSGDIVHSTRESPHLHFHSTVPSNAICPKDLLSQKSCKEEQARPDVARMRRSPFQVPVCADEDKFTIVLLTHGENRIKLLLQCLKNYSKMARVDRIIVVWTNPGLEPPWSAFNNISYAMPLEVIQAPDSLQIRFQHFKEIKTQGVFTVDDDLIISEMDLNYAFEVWKRHAYGIVCFNDNARGHAAQKTPGEYSYLMHKRSYSIALTSAAFLHSEYLRMYTETLPTDIREFVDKEFNCEDIAMNMVIANHTGCAAALHIQEKNKIIHIAQQGGPGLGSRKTHGQQRSDCIGRFAKSFGGLPLKSTKCVY